MAPHAARSRETSFDDALILIPETEPFGMMANRMTALPRFRLSGFRYHRIPCLTDSLYYLVEVGSEIYTHGVADDLDLLIRLGAVARTS